MEAVCKKLVETEEFLKSEGYEPVNPFEDSDTDINNIADDADASSQYP